MKPAQWMTALALAALVGGITFIVVYLGNSRPRTDVPPPTPASLTFVAKQFPQEGDKALTTEINQLGHQDYWFRNESGQDVPVGLNEKGCTCSQVEVSIAPESWTSRLLDESAGRYLQRAASLSPRVPESLRELSAAYALDSAATQLPEEEARTTLLTRDNSVVVPAGAFGWVRMGWRRHNPEVVRLHAEVWMSQRGGASSARLEAGVLIARPVEVNKEMSLGPFSLRDLEKDQKTWLLCWSLTRPSFDIKVEAVHARRKADSDPVEIGQPIPLTDAYLRHLEKSSEKLHMVRLLSGYRIPVTVRGRAKDGTPIEWGHFRRLVNLSSEDPGIEPVQVKLLGEVHGDVTVGSGKEGGTINLGPFLRSRGTRGEIVLQTDTPNINLEIDSSHRPEFLQVRFPDKPEVSPGGHRMWVLEVKIPPNAARGEFPRADDPVYHDSAIYVKTKEKSPRTIRIPVMGAANEG